MKILYIANIRIPTEKAHGFQIMKTGEEFTKQGQVVTLLVAKRFNSGALKRQNPFEYYGIKKQFPLKKLFCIDLIFGSMYKLIGPLAFWLQSVTFIISLKLHLLKNRYDLIYCRDEPVLAALLNYNNLVYEAHKAPGAKYKLMLSRVQKIICITNIIKKEIIKQGIASEKILVAPDAVDLAEFSVKQSQRQCRAELKLPVEKKLAIYTGHLFAWKGVYTLADAAALLPENFLVIFVGGAPYDVNELKNYIKVNNIKNTKLIGHVKRKYIPPYLAAADIAVLPNSAKSKISKFYTSPLKMFEYLAARRPVVASDLPSIREVLDESCAVLVPSDDPKILAEAIIKAATADNKKIINAAYQKVKNYTWEKRTEKILKFISK